LIGLLALAVGVLAAWLVGSSFSRRLRKIANSATAVARGDLAAPPLTLENRDEIGQLAEAFNAMLGNLQQLVGEIATAAVRLHAAARSFTDVADRQRQGATRQSGAVDQGRSTVEALAESAERLVKTSREICESAELALKDAERPLESGAVGLERLANFLSKTRTSVAEIGRISEDAQGATEESLFVMQAVADVADETVESSKEVVRAAEGLVRLSESLEGLIGGFVLSRAESSLSQTAHEPQYLAAAAE
jgi:methyl-accepting chemotaxis protein